MPTVKVILAHPVAISRAHIAIDEAAPGSVVEIREPDKSRLQEAKYHAMVSDIAKQALFMGQKWHSEDWKRLLVDAFATAMREAGTPLRHDGRVVPSLDMHRTVQLGIQTRKLLRSEASQFIEYLYAWGTDRDEPIVWKDPTVADDYIRWANERRGN